MHFCLMKSVSGANVALDVKSFCQNARTALMKKIVSLCCNVDRSFDRDQCKQFHENMNEKINSCETVLSDQLKIKWSSMMGIKSNEQSHVHSNNTLPCTSGCCVKKLIKNKIGECEECMKKFPAAQI